MINKLGVKVMAIKKEKFFEIIRNVNESEGLNKDNLLERIGSELRNKDYAEYNKFKRNFSKEHQFSIEISDKIEDWTLLHLAVACNDLLTVTLLLEKKVSVKTRVKDGSKDDGLTALHIAALHGHQEIVQLLLDANANPLLKDSQDRTPMDIVGDVEGKEAIIEMLEKGEQRYVEARATRRQTYRQGTLNNKTPEDLVVNRNNAAAALENGNKRTSLNSTDESSDSTVDEQRQSVKDMIKIFESPQRRNTTCSGKQTSISLNKSGNSDDSGICTESEDEADIDAKNEELKKLEKELAESKSCIAEHETTLEALKKQNQKENESLKRKIQDLESEKATLNSELKKTKTKTNEVSLGKAHKVLAELKGCVAGHETKLEVLEKLNEENRPLSKFI